ncbi:MAG: Uma2 family endonuclease [Symploca sp. SIO1C4]|uniref:Uma2 family endonuclease n=1 Tax=Symploca sp. SIO1C4 TaxID=2607765 RepID=A0A6B3NJR8_9CYAN|nr:Uma2 family endonuclease [Symploca sp. SIO1C4]
MLATTAKYDIAWEKLPDDYVLDDEPVDNINQPSLAAALTESLEIAGKLPANTLATTNYGICATVNQKIVVKAPDWSYITNLRVSRAEIKRSYTPQLQGDTPVIVMEFISNTQGSEYSNKPTYPPGKWFFYERILKIANYVIFEPDTGALEVYKLDSLGQYQLTNPDSNNRYWIAQMNLFLGLWQGTRENRTGYWLRWWNDQGEILLWGSERAERLAAQLRAAGIEPEI